MRATKIDPSARGTVEVKRDKNDGNAKVTVKVEHLADPAQLTPRAEGYVVWVTAKGQKARNEGMVRVDKSEKGNVEFTTTATKFTVLITAENDGHASKPSDRVVLRSDVRG
jgi:hypothetical protein